MSSKKHSCVYCVQIRIDYQYTPRRLFRTQQGAQIWALLKIEQLLELGIKGLPQITKEEINE